MFGVVSFSYVNTCDALASCKLMCAICLAPLVLATERTTHTDRLVDLARKRITVEMEKDKNRNRNKPYDEKNARGS